MKPLIFPPTQSLRPLPTGAVQPLRRTGDVSMAGTTALPTAAETRAAPKPKLLKRLREASRSRHCSRRTEQTYCASARLAKAAVPGSADGLIRFIGLLSFVPRKRIGRDERSGRGHRRFQQPQPESCVLDSPNRPQAPCYGPTRREAAQFNPPAADHCGRSAPQKPLRRSPERK